VLVALPEEILKRIEIARDIVASLGGASDHSTGIHNHGFDVH